MRQGSDDVNRTCVPPGWAAAIVSVVFFMSSVWACLTGTREAIRRDGYGIDPLSLTFCSHEWIIFCLLRVEEMRPFRV
jgi:hypothetical protein